MIDPANAPSGDNNTAEIDAAFQPAKADDFALPREVFPEGMSEPRMVEQAAQFRGWLEEARLPAAIGNTLAGEVAAANKAFTAMNDAERTLYQRSERAHLERLWGEETQRKIELAHQLVMEIEERRPGLVDLLEGGAGNSAMVILNLALHAERLAARQGGEI